ncbi:YdbL family protein [Methyloglobulus sp.]|uniref:YdbL family protein n=1 Tax=Methyloglobulus sp. TaxID=2518622 RepID=UPI00398A3423
MKKISLLGVLMLAACVTINIYFPAAAAEKVADEIIKDIQGNAPQKPELDLKPEPKSERSDFQTSFYKIIDQAINHTISPAQAAEADLSIDSPEIRQLTASMEKRFSALQGFYAAGAIGIQADGFLAVRDAASVPLKDRNQVNKLVVGENADRQALYQAIANANGHPEWVTQIKSTFATRWISNAQSGWWYQSSGVWKQK